MSREETIKEKILSGLFWKIMERGGARGIQFVVSLFLARLLLPQDYGLIALISFFITIGNVFVQSGFNSALIQKKQVDEKDFSTIFCITLCVSTVIYIILFFGAPTVANFFDEPLLSSTLRVLSLILFLSPVTSIQNAIISRSMQFKKLFFSSLGGVIISGTTGIIMAYKGFGAWSLVGQQLTNELSVMVILGFTVNWRPRFVFSSERFWSLFSYGWKLLCSALLDAFYTNIYSLVIGKIYSPRMLGFYSRGDQFPQIVITNVDSSIQSVLFPALSSQQDDRARVKDMVRRSIVTSSYLIFPMMMGLAVCAEPLVRVLLTEKWLPCVPFLQILCFSYILWPIHTANLQAINALGRSDIFLKLEVIKKIIGFATLGISIPFGIWVMVALKPINGLISSIINAYPNSQLLNYSIREQWIDVLPSFCLSLVMATFVFALKFLGWNSLLTLIIQIISGAAIYFTLSYLLKLESFIYLLDCLKVLFQKRDRRIRQTR